MQPVTPSLLHGLNPEQRAAILSEEERLLVLACSGVVKTKTLIQKSPPLICNSRFGSDGH